MQREIKIGFTGDFCLAEAHIKPDGYAEHACSFSKSLNENVDLAIANHEFCIAPPKTVDVRGMGLPIENSEIIKEAGFDVFCLANNHIGDYGEETLLHTKEFLEQQGHKTVGIGENVNEAIKPLFFEKNGFNIAVVNFCDATQYAADEDVAGLAHIELGLLKKSLADAKERADLIILVLHSDLEFTNYPSPWRVALSRELAKLGPDLIIQHHPHTLQGIEYYDSCLIAYSLGNFIFQAHGTAYGDGRRGNLDQSVYLTIRVTDGDEGRKIDYELTPIIINEDNCTYLASEQQSDEILSKMEKYSEGLNDPSFLRRHYFAECRNQMDTLFWDTYYTVAKKGIKAGIKYIHTHLKTKAHTNWMRGFFTFGKY